MCKYMCALLKFRRWISINTAKLICAIDSKLNLLPPIIILFKNTRNFKLFFDKHHCATKGPTVRECFPGRKL